MSRIRDITVKRFIPGVEFILYFKAAILLLVMNNRDFCRVTALFKARQFPGTTAIFAHI